MEKHTDFLTIGKLAKKANVNIETIRYYERKGLIPKPPRNNSGYRQYPLDAVKRIRFIKSAQKLGFSLNQIVELLQLRVEPKNCVEIKKRTKAKIKEVEQKIEALKRIKNTLAKLDLRCDKERPINECPILESFENYNADIF